MRGWIRGTRMGRGIIAAGLLLMAQAVTQAVADAPAASGTESILAAVKERAIEQVLNSSRSPDPFLRANAVEAMQPLPDRALPLAQLGLDDEHEAVRFASLVTIGRLKLTPLGTAAAQRINDPSPSVRAAAMFAAHLCGSQVDISQMAMLLQSPNPSVRGNVAMLLGLMGEPSAAPMLQELAAVPMPKASAVRQSLVRLQIAEAMAWLGDASALNAVRAGAYSPFDEVRVLAVQAMGKLGDRWMTTAIVQMLDEPPIELQLAAAETLARLGRDQGLPVMLQGAQSDLPPVRAQAAFALGQLHHKPEAAQALVRLLDDPQEQVRLSAAAAILQAMKP